MNLSLFLKLGLRNILKYKRKSIQILAVIFTGALVITVIAGFTMGMFEKFLTDMIENTAHGKIFHSGYYQKQEISPLELSIDNYRSVINGIAAADKSILFSPAITAGAVVSRGDNSLNMLCLGIVPYADKKWKNIFPIYKVYESAVFRGKFFTSNEEQGILISSFTAAALKCGLNDKIIIFTSDSYGSFNAVELKVTGIFKTGYRDKDENICLIDLKSMQKLTGLENKVTEISLFFDDINKSDVFGAQAGAIFKKHNLEYFAWKHLLGAFVYMVDIGEKFYLIIYLIFITVAVLGIMNTILISVFDRIRDIGTLRSIGFTKNNVTMMLFAEVLLLGILGSITGTALGAGIIYYFSVYGIPIPESSQDLVTFLSGSRIYPAFKFEYLFAPGIISALVPVLSSLYPIVIMRKMKIREALGYL